MTKVLENRRVDGYLFHQSTRLGHGRIEGGLSVRCALIKKINHSTPVDKLRLWGVSHLKVYRLTAVRDVALGEF